MASAKQDGGTTSALPGYVRSQSSPVRSPTSISHRKEKNWIKTTFKKRDCSFFVPAYKDQEGDDAVCLCGRTQKNHKLLYYYGDYGEEWNPATHTIQSKTDAFGEMEFQGAWTTTRSKYIRVSSDVEPKNLLRLLTKEWGVEHPKLLIEVTGGAKNFVMQPKLRRIFRHGIIKAATTTNAWVLTGGTNTGVMKYVGEALHEHTLRSQRRIVAIGIAAWGIVLNRESMTKRGQIVSYRLHGGTEQKGASLDPNHTHLILVDDGKEGHYGADIPVRAKLLKLMARTHDDSGEFGDMFTDRAIPAVCVVLGGGFGTIKVVLKNISRDPIIPAVVVNGSGMGADLIAYVASKSDQNGELSDRVLAQIQRKINEMFPRDQDKHKKLLKNLKKIAKNKRQITVYSADDEGDIDHAILNALHKATNLSPPQQLKLALNWNRVDVAKEIFEGTTEWEDRVLYESFQISLSLNRVGFAGLLMEQGIDVGEYLTMEKLESLYNAQEDRASPTLSTIFRSCNVAPSKIGEITMRSIGKVVKGLLGHGIKPYDTKQPNGAATQDGQVQGSESYKRQQAYNHLFLWALLTKKFDMAYLIWTRSRESIAKALIGVRLCQKMGKVAEKSYNTDAVNELEKQNKRYEQLAMDLLDKCYREDTKYTRHLLRAEHPKWNQHTCVTLAASFELTRFIAHPALQVLLNDQWYGRLNKVVHPKRLQQQMLSEVEEKEKIANTKSMDKIEGYDPEDMIEMATSGIRQEHQILLHHFLMTGEDEAEIQDADLLQDDGDVEDESGSEAGILEDHLHHPLWELEFYESPESRFAKAREYMQAPVVKFWVDTVSYLIFLALFTYMVVFSRGAMIFTEWIVAIFMFSFAMEEIRQIIFPDSFALFDIPITAKIRLWASDFWNFVDITGIVFFWCGFFLRVAIEISDREESPYSTIFVSARIFYCMAIMVWYVRLLDILSVSEVMGPYVNMIFKMGKDAASFMLIAMVFMFSYGIVRGALLEHKDLVFNGVAIPYWQFYGELFLEDDGRLVCPEEGCPPGANFVYIALAIYLLIANVVLLNMLIAIFNNTFERVKEHSDEIWKYQRYRLIMVYCNRPLLPPPLILLAHIWLMGKYIFTRCKKSRFLATNAMRMRFGETTSQLLYNFEESCMEDYLRQQNIQGQYSLQGTMQRISDRVDNFGTLLEEQQAAEAKSFAEFNNRLENLEAQTAKIVEAFRGAITPDSQTMKTFQDLGSSS